MSLRNLPFEIIGLIVESLDLEDVRNLSLASHKFDFLTREPNICKAILQRKAPHSPEAKDARTTEQYARALRRLIKRREALCSASPYLVAIVAVADSYIYCNGQLCYINERKLRIVDLHAPDGTEIDIDIRKLLDVAIKASRMSRRYRFEPLYMAHDIVSCLYTHSFDNEQTSWLVVFNAKLKRILTAPRLVSSYKIFVRNNETHLYYGLHSDIGDDGFRRWTLKGFDIRAGQWLDKFYLADLAGSDVGSTLSFEIFDNYLYGISSQPTFEVEEIDWSSYYSSFRFPLGQPDDDHLEWASKRVMWRRQHAEGPLDDRWSCLKLWRDEASGQLKVTEARKEYLAGHNASRRTYYTTDLVFPEEVADDCSDGGGGGDDEYPDDDPLVGAIDKDDRPNYMLPQKRNPHYVHPGDDGSSSLCYTLNRVYIRSYHPPCQTFLDLVDDGLNSYPPAHRIRLKVGSRRQMPPVDQTGRPQPPPSANTIEATDQDIGRLYQHSPLIFWPPTSGVGCQADTWLEALHGIMNPRGFQGNVTGTSDDRSLVYGVGKTSDDNQAIVFVSFDPGVYIEGLVPFVGALPLKQPALSRLGSVLEGNQARADGRGEQTQRPSDRTCLPVLPEEPPPSPQQRSATGSLPSSEDLAEPFDTSWSRLESPMYEAIRRGFYFAK